MATDDRRQRMESLASPNAVKWVVEQSSWFSLNAVEYRYALRWILGVPIRSEAYMCQDCGAMADATGSHAVACTAVGAAARGHSVAKFLFGSLFRAAGCRAEFEWGPSNSLERPADILIHGAGPRPQAIHFTIWTRLGAQQDAIDAVIARKMAKSKAICAQEGWSFAVWASDSYGWIHPTARRMTGKLVRVRVRVAPC